MKVNFISRKGTEHFAAPILNYINNNSASNTIRGVYHNARTSDGGTNLNTLEFITIATTGNATDFGDLNYAANSGCGLSDSHGGLPL